jgi:hypothetical protein
LAARLSRAAKAAHSGNGNEAVEIGKAETIIVRLPARATSVVQLEARRAPERLAENA